MSKDSILKKALKAGDAPGLPYGFDLKVMNSVLMLAEKKKKHAWIREMWPVAAVTLAMITACGFILKHFFDFEFRSFLSGMLKGPEDRRLLLFFIYVAVLALFLLFLDTLFRRLRDRKSA